MLRDLLIALSLSNLCFLRIWNELFNGKLTYYAQVAPTNHLAAVVLNVLLLALVFWTGAQLARRSRNRALLRLAHWTFLLVVLADLRLFYLLFMVWGRWGRMAGIFGVLLLAAGLCLLARWEARIAHVFAVLLVIVSPFIAVTFYQDIALAIRVSRTSFTDQPLASSKPVCVKPNPG